MSGQSAGLSISEAKTMMKRTEACGPANAHQGSTHKGSKGMEVMKKESHQGK